MSGFSNVAVTPTFDEFRRIVNATLHENLVSLDMVKRQLQRDAPALFRMTKKGYAPPWLSFSTGRDRFLFTEEAEFLVSANRAGYSPQTRRSFVRDCMAERAERLESIVMVATKLPNVSSTSEHLEAAFVAGRLRTLDQMTKGTVFSILCFPFGRGQLDNLASTTGLPVGVVGLVRGKRVIDVRDVALVHLRYALCKQEN